MSDDAQYRLTDEGIAISPSDEWHLATGELDVAHDLIHEDELSIVYGVPLREVRAWAGFMDVEPETMLSVMYVEALSLMGHSDMLETFASRVPMVIVQHE
jgi:hypothetical protein